MPGVAGAGIALPIISALSGLGGAAVGAGATWATQRWVHREQAATAKQHRNQDEMYAAAKALMSAVSRCDLLVPNAVLGNGVQWLAAYQEAAAQINQASLFLSRTTIGAAVAWLGAQYDSNVAIGDETELERKKAVADERRDAITTADALLIVSIQLDLGLA